MNGASPPPGFGSGPFPNRQSSSQVYAKEQVMAMQFGLDEKSEPGQTVALQAFNGRHGVIDGVIREFGVDPAPRTTSAGLLPNTTYWAYAEWDGQKVVIRQTRNAPIADRTGQSVDRLNPTSTTAGMFHTNSLGRYEANRRHQLIATWNWRLPNMCVAELEAATVFPQQTDFMPVSNKTKCEFVSWGYSQTAYVSGTVIGSATGMTLHWGIMLDRGLPSQHMVKSDTMVLGQAGHSANITLMGMLFTSFSPGDVTNPNDGYHTLELVAWPVGGSVTFSAKTEVGTQVWQ